MGVEGLTESGANAAQRTEEANRAEAERNERAAQNARNRSAENLTPNESEMQTIVRRMIGDRSATGEANSDDTPQAAPNSLALGIPVGFRPDEFFERLGDAWDRVEGVATRTAENVRDSVEIRVRGDVTALRGAAMNVVEGGSNIINGIGGAINETLPAARDFASAANTTFRSTFEAARDIIFSSRFEIDGTRLEEIRAAYERLQEGLHSAQRDYESGLQRLGQADFSDELNQIRQGAVQAFVQMPGEAAAVLLTSHTSAVQTLFGVQAPARSLEEAEIEQLRRVYGDSIDYSRIRVHEGNLGLLGQAQLLANDEPRPFTIGDTIYVPTERLAANGRIDMELLVHETAHVWQYQNGGTTYLSRSIIEQVRHGSGPDGAYNFERGISEGRTWEQLNPEQQAALLEAVYTQAPTFFDDPQNNRFVYKKNQNDPGTDYTDYVRRVLPQVRNGQGAP